MTMRVEGLRVWTYPSYAVMQKEDGKGGCIADENGFYVELVKRQRKKKPMRVIALQGPYLEIKIPMSRIDIKPDSNITL